MKTIRIENNFARVCPGLKIGIIGAQVTNTETDPRLWEQIDDEASRIAAAYKIDEINKPHEKPIGLSVKTPIGIEFPPRPFAGALSEVWESIASIRWSISSIWSLSVRDTPSELSTPIVSKETLSFWESGKKEKSSEVSAGAFSISKGSRFTATIKEV